MSTMSDGLGKLPLIAILRGIIPNKAREVANVLIESGITIMEVPLNSPNALESIEQIAETLPDHCSIGAGTVLTVEQVRECDQAGAQIIVSPNTDEEVIRATVSRGLHSIPGVATATEAFKAIHAGANYLKLFPADTYGYSHVKALKAVLPVESKLFAVGGVNTQNLTDWHKAGCDGFGLGSFLFKPDMALSEIKHIALQLVSKREQLLNDV